MLKFLVIVGCAAGATCPIPGTIKRTMEAPSAHACRAVVEKAIKSYNYEPKHFSISCTPTK